ncbi:hypothetical protein PENVUL_c030G00570 [Penicillium vulpinum]|uniref:Uncharacterized protein n=1 Tax=Penicillium vulpinum TaxID=29845 RepID=A0A1V6RTG2_9EURO|nr:hypothetical protein PENVUL_c030G00570 [Penicillium vulpinum]
MAVDSMPREEIIGVVIGAVALFSLISMIPVMIMWHHRRREAMQAMAETRVLPPVYQVQLQDVLGQPVSVDRWLEEQNVPANAQQYGQDTCTVVIPISRLSRLSRSSSRPTQSRPDYTDGPPLHLRGTTFPTR